MSKNLNKGAIGSNLFKWLLNNIPKEYRILEIGSGTGTIELGKHFDNVSSIENNEKWMNMTDKVNYIHAPIINGWFDTKTLEKHLLDKQFDVVIVDAPRGSDRRYNLYKNRHLFNNINDIIFIIDDCHRPYEVKLTKKLAELTNNKYKFFDDGNKKFSILNYDKLTGK